MAEVVTFKTLSCRQLIGDLDDYLGGHLTPRRREGFSRHLASCKPCASYVEGYRVTLDLVLAAARADSTERAEVPEDLVSAILQALPATEARVS